MPLIPLGDLQPPRYFYLYYSVDSFPERTLVFSIREETGDEILRVTFAVDAAGSMACPMALFPLKVWAYKPEARTLKRLFDGVTPASSPRAFWRFIRALKARGIKRYTLDQSSGTYIPWAQRHNAQNFNIARALIVGGRFRGL